MIPTLPASRSFSAPSLGVWVKKNRLVGGGMLCIFYEFVYTLAPPPCSAGIIMTTTIITTAIIPVTLNSLFFNIKFEYTTNVRLPVEINKELYPLTP